jgi:hypothetical protein
MKRLAYLPIVLLLSAQVDDILVAGLNVAPAVDVDDEFLPTLTQSPVDSAASDRRPPPLTRTTPAATVPVCRGVPSAWALTSPPPSSVFLSLRI